MILRRGKQWVRGTSLIEISVAMGLLGIFGLSIYSVLNIGIILGAKNAAVNTAHQQARTAMLQMVSDLHSAISLPALTDINGAPLVNPSPNTAAPGIAFQMWSAGPYKIASDAAAGTSIIKLVIPAGALVPVAGQRVLITSHRIESDITAVTVASPQVYNVTLAAPLPVAINGTGGPTYYHITCGIADRCSYLVKNNSLQWKGPTVRKTFSILGSDIVSATPFTTPSTPGGSLYYRFVAAINLSTSDGNYSNRGFKSANILLNGQVPMRARIALYQ